MTPRSCIRRTRRSAVVSQKATSQAIDYAWSSSSCGIKSSREHLADVDIDPSVAKVLFVDDPVAIPNSLEVRG